MNKLEQAAWLALDVLENERCHVSANWDNVVKAITALREALAEKAEQPVAYKYRESSPETGEFVFAEPVRTKDLTDEEIDAIEIITDRQFARAVIEKFKEKNK